MSTFKTSLKILWAHRVHIRRYLVLLSMFGLLAAGGGASAASDEVIDAPIPVAVIDRDGSTISQGVARYVESIDDAQPLEDSTRALQDATAQNRIAYILIIPAGYGEEFQKAARQGTEPPAADTVVNYESAAGSLMDVRTGSYLAQVHDYLGALNDDPAQAVSLADGAMERTASAQLVPQDSAPMPKRLMTFATFSLYPLLTFSVVSISTLMTALGRRPVRSRMSAAPVSGRARGLGLLGACLIIGLVGWAWIFGLGVHFFGKEYLATSAPMVGVLGAALGAYTLVSVSLGFLLGQLGLGDNATNAIANIGGMVMSVLGGAWISVDMLPDAVVAFSRFTPGYWAARAITGLHDAASISSDTILPLLADCGVCALFAVALLSVGIAVGRTRARSAL